MTEKPRREYRLKIAAIVMGTYMWRTHPELGHELRQALGGVER
jgi:hypothetical protein